MRSSADRAWARLASLAPAGPAAAPGFLEVRATEIAAVLLRDGRIVDRYQSLTNAGAWVPPVIEELTGITNDMVRVAPRRGSRR